MGDSENKTHSFSLEFPPSVNTVYAVFRNRKVLSKKGRMYKEKVADMLGTYTNSYEGPISCTYTFYRGDARRYDISNFIKTVEDCLTESKLWKDDSQVTEIHIYKGEIDRDNPRVEIEVNFKEDV